MLDTKLTGRGVGSGLDALDAVLGGLFWGDNVVWQLEGAPSQPFYTAIAGRREQFDSRLFVALREDAEPPAPGLELIRAGPGTTLPGAADLLRELSRLCAPRRRRLVLFETMDSMLAVWGLATTQAFFARCCPMLLDVGAIAYWSMSASAPQALRDTVASVTQCVLRVDERSVRVTKAEGRPRGVRGSVLHWYVEDGRPVLEAADVIARVAASLRSLRRARGLSQHELADLAGVTPSAISQAERAERGLSLATLARLSAALEITVDDLLHGEDPEPYRIGRRAVDRSGGASTTAPLLTDPSGLSVDLVRLRPREAGGPQDSPGAGTVAVQPTGFRGIVAVAQGLVQVLVAGQAPAVRAGEVLIADSERVAGWRNIGRADAVLFWIVVGPPPAGAQRPR
ncbi:MAG TPA: helix-turn-helix domain-containing protein [Solirubrobacteraceae bacterium]|nr:helix-turn-helix domain-containing protein [Solirubrobacteraceae bacterium]